MVFERKRSIPLLQREESLFDAASPTAAGTKAVVSSHRDPKLGGKGWDSRRTHSWKGLMSLVCKRDH